jgi:hypothetical protein
MNSKSVNKTRGGGGCCKQSAKNKTKDHATTDSSFPGWGDVYSEGTQTPTWSAHDPDPPKRFANGFFADPDRNSPCEIQPDSMNRESNFDNRLIPLIHSGSIGRLLRSFGDDTHPCKLDRWSMRMSPRRFHRISKKNRNVMAPHPNGPPTKAPARHPNARIGGPQTYDSSSSHFDSIAIVLIAKSDNFDPMPISQDSRPLSFDARTLADASKTSRYVSQSNDSAEMANPSVIGASQNVPVTNSYVSRAFENGIQTNANAAESFRNAPKALDYVSPTNKRVPESFEPMAFT